MAYIIWSPRAVADFEEIVEYISSDSEYYALALAKDIFNAIKSLKLFPNSGRIVPEFNRPELRERIYKGYRIIYRIAKERIEIVAIVHHARLLPEENEAGEDS
ncbi:MAG: type II toxin-antitoxin system RelE/ParE family toxin [bacterium]|nr:type II toxin-antitoxin system RelE/ParE family toxin [bacterium]